MRDAVTFGIIIVTAVLIGCSTPVKAPVVNKDSIRANISSVSPKIQRCYEDSLLKSPNLKGKLVLEWQIIEGGKVEKARVVSSELKNPGVEKCVMGVLKGIKFNPPSKDQIAVVSFPFVFKRF